MKEEYDKSARENWDNLSKEQKQEVVLYESELEIKKVKDEMGRKLSELEE